MPTISTFYGILIKMFFVDHAPPHFRAQYGEYKAVISIKELSVVDGSLPRRALNLVLDWAELHQEELLQNWNLASANEMPNTIQPLE